MQVEWTSDWIWSLVLILFTMILHVLVLARVFRLIVGAYDRARHRSAAHRYAQACS